MNEHRSMATRDRVHALLAPAGTMAQRYDDVWQSVWRQPHIPAEVLELCRLRIARLQGASADLVVPPSGDRVPAVDPELRAAVLEGRYAREPRIGPGERAAIEFTEVYAVDPQAITDELAHEVTAHFGEAGLVALIEALGFIDGRFRLARMLAPLLGAACP